MSLVNPGLLLFLTYTRLSAFSSQDKQGSNLVLPPKSVNKDSLHEREKRSSGRTNDKMVAGKLCYFLVSVHLCKDGHSGSPCSAISHRSSLK